MARSPDRAEQVPGDGIGFGLGFAVGPGKSQYGHNGSDEASRPI